MRFVVRPRETISASRHDILGLQTYVKFLRFLHAWKFNEDQPRDEHGRWTETGADDAADSGDQVTVSDILSRAKTLNLAARSDKWQTCLDLCYPLLERFQPPGSDKNDWDFHKCMNICLSAKR